jgi:23S rRNA (uracil1939-C5)-methyltransferase
MEFSFSQAKDGTHFLGLYGAGSRRVIDISSCYIAPEWMTCALAEVRAWWKTTGLMAYRQNVNEGTLLTVCFREARSSHDRMVILTVSGVPEFAPKREQLDLFVQSLRAAVTPQQGSLSIVLRVRQIAKGRPTQMFEMILFGPDHMKETVSVTIDGVQKKLECHISPPTFFQPNTPQAEKIYSHALSSARLNATDVVADLYCGLGLFGMFSAFFASSAFGVELSKDAAYDATVNSQRLGISNFAVRCGDVAKICNDLPKAPSVVIVDPPRSGLGAGGIDAVESLHPSRIVYVSCQPKTQGTDVQTLMEHGWTIESVQPIDQFPHTMHVENIVVLSKI